MLTSQSVKQQLTQLTSSKKLLVAYSGGLDSHVLLHLVSTLPDYQVRAIHIHHGLQDIADSWVAHCELICHNLNIPLEIIHLNLTEDSGESIEAMARNGRNQAFKTTLQADEVLLTAHHQNDQAETLLLQLFRGAGVQGLASMPKIIDFGEAKHARPLLSSNQQLLQSYAKQNQLKFIEDPSNKNLSFDRNFLRSKIIPQLRERWSSIDKTISRSASIQAENLDILNEIAEEDLLNVLSRKGNTLSIKVLLRLSKPRQKLLVRLWITKNDYPYPSIKKLEHIFQDVVHAKEDAQPLVEWGDINGNVQIRRFKNQLYIMDALSEHDGAQTFLWNTKTPLEIKSLGITLKAEQLQTQAKEVRVQFRQGGEAINLPERGGNISLKNYMFESGIPPWLRSRVPLFFVDGELVEIWNLVE